MFRIRIPFLLLIVSLFAVILVGIGLFLWLDSVRDSEARQLYNYLDNAAGRIQSEIALEFSVIAALFTYDIKTVTEAADSSDEALFNHVSLVVPILHEKWLYGTRFPGFVDEIFYLDNSGDEPRIFRLTGDQNRLKEAITVDDDYSEAELIRNLATSDDESGSYRIVSYQDGLSLVIPVERYSWNELDEKRKTRDFVGYFVVLIDREYFANEVAADLFEAYLGRGDRFDFAVVAGENDEVLYSSSNRSSNGFSMPPRFDRIVPLTAWISVENSFLTDVLTASVKEPSALPQAAFSARVADLFIRQWFGLAKLRSSDAASVERTSSTALRAAGADSGSGLRLKIWHSSGSIDAAVRSLRNRRLAAGYSILTCFAVVAIVFYLLYLQAKRLSDREHEFVATVTHELRTPVSGVNAVADNLAEGVVVAPEKVREYGRAILDHGRRLRNLIDQVLLYAGLSGSTKSAKAESIELDSFVREVADRVPSMPRERLIIHVQSEVRSYSGDSFAIETIVTNLLSNAAKHSGESSTVTMNVYREIRRNRPCLVIRVSDSGRGIPKRELKRVVEPFYRGETSRSNQTPGSGLGLSLVSRIVRTYRGSLSISSSAGRGAIVTARLPMAREP